MAEVWAVILAAGESKRMGTQKLLLPFGNLTMIEKVIENILRADIRRVMVVLGSHSGEIQKIISRLPVSFCLNTDFASGMFSSVKCGFNALPPSAEAALLFLGDQPSIPPEVIKKVCDTFHLTHKGIVIPVAEGKRGHPSLFSLRLLPDINRLDPEGGLRQLALEFPSEVLEVETGSEEILRDIDTKIDYLNELKQSK